MGARYAPKGDRDAADFVSGGPTSRGLRSARLARPTRRGANRQRVPAGPDYHPRARRSSVSNGKAGRDNGAAIEPVQGQAADWSHAAGAEPGCAAIFSRRPDPAHDQSAMEVHPHAGRRVSRSDHREQVQRLGLQPRWPDNSRDPIGRWFSSSSSAAAAGCRKRN